MSLKNRIKVYDTIGLFETQSKDMNPCYKNREFGVYFK
jgi:hypothetical protein